ncbi:MAG: hypothetical protein PF693_17705 [Spirochaetia bacterium]|nr:hypothetical protein [Spirochaetia bacterium]
MSQEEEKAKLFVSRLLSNPTLLTLNPLQKEDQIMSFMDLNADQLKPTLTSNAFFLGKSWFEIHKLLIKTLRILIDESLFPGIQRQLYEKIDFRFISILRQQNWPQEKIKEEVLNLIKKIVSSSDGRKDFSGSYNAISRQIVDKYVNSIFTNHTYIHFELTKVQRLKMSKEEVKDMINTSLLLRPSIYVFSSNMNKDSSSGIITQTFAEKVEETLIKEIPALPEKLVKSAVRINLSFEDHKYLQATSRLTSIINSMARSFKADMKIDRGASSPEKSWFSIARKNYKYFGWDIKMLDELYRFSAENNW